MSLLRYALACPAPATQLNPAPRFPLQVNNYLKFAMQLFFKPTTAKMLGNLKVGWRRPQGDKGVGSRGLSPAHARPR